MAIDWWEAWDLSADTHPEAVSVATAHLEGYEPTGPWEPVGSGGEYKIIWRRPYRKKLSDLEKLAAVSEMSDDLDDIHRLANVLIELIDKLREDR